MQTGMNMTRKGFIGSALATIDPKIMSLEGFSAKRNDAQLNI